MKKFLYVLGAVGAISATAALFAHADTTAAKPAATTLRKIVLEKKNTVSLRLPIFASTAQNVKEALIAKDAALPAGEPIYLFQETPGGDIVAGEALIQTALSLGREVKTINNFAASMGFINAQSLGERLVTPNGTLMAHRAYVGIDGQIPGEFNTMASFIQESVEALEHRVSARMGISHKDYQTLVKDEYWVTGAKAVAAGAADAVVQVSCASDLQGEYYESVSTFFGNVEVTWKECPLLADYVDVNFSDMRFSSEAERDRVTSLIRTSLTNRRSVATDVSVRNALARIMR